MTLHATSYTTYRDPPSPAGDAPPPPPVGRLYNFTPALLNQLFTNLMSLILCFERLRAFSAQAIPLLPPASASSAHALFG